MADNKTYTLSYSAEEIDAKIGDIKNKEDVSNKVLSTDLKSYSPAPNEYEDAQYFSAKATATIIDVLYGEYKNTSDVVSGLATSLVNSYYNKTKIDEMFGDVNSALDELHNYAQSLIGGDAS